MGESPLYDPFDAMSFSYSNCFLCGCLLQDDKSVEHIFTKWLQNKYDLWDKRIRLLNRTSIPYRKLTIPCCGECNTLYLSPLEQTIKRRVEEGYQSFIQLDKLLVYQWILKLFYGLLFKELSLFMEQRNPEAGSITSPDLLAEFRHLHAFLQSVRVPFEFVGFHPWSMFMVNMRSRGNHTDFDYHDELINMTFSIRLGDIGIIVCLEDRGAQEDLYSDYWRRFDGVRLHPMQFDEMFAKVTYRASLMNRVPKFVMARSEGENKKVIVASPSLQGCSTAAVYEEWSQKDYASWLAWYWKKYGLAFDDVYREPDMVLSLVEDENGRVPYLDM